MIHFKNNSEIDIVWVRIEDILPYEGINKAILQQSITSLKKLKLNKFNPTLGLMLGILGYLVNNLNNNLSIKKNIYRRFIDLCITLDRDIYISLLSSGIIITDVIDEC